MPKSFKEQLESIQHLSFRNTQAYYWFTYDLFIEEHRQFKNEAKQEIMTTIFNRLNHTIRKRMFFGKSLTIKKQV